MTRSPVLQVLLDQMTQSFGLSAAFLEASDHKYNCRCGACLTYWSQMPPEEEGPLLEDGLQGPFTWKEVWEYQDRLGQPRTKPLEQLPDDPGVDVHFLIE